MRCTSLLVAVVFANVMLAQAPVTPERMDVAKEETARTVQQVDALLAQIGATQDAIARALAAAKASAAQTEGVGMERAARVTGELKARLEDLGSTLGERTTALKELRSRLAAEAPVKPAAEDELAAMRARLAAAQKEPALPDVQKGVEQIERELIGKEWKGRPGADELLAVVRFRLAETLRQRAMLEIQKGRSREAEGTYAIASEKYSAALTGADSPNSGEGSSMHAVALYRLVQINASLYAAYKQLVTANPADATSRAKMNRYRAAAVDAFEKVSRLHPHATLADGRNVVEVARADARLY